jgi:hypothetical protein
MNWRELVFCDAQRFAQYFGAGLGEQSATAATSLVFNASPAKKRQSSRQRLLRASSRLQFSNHGDEISSRERWRQQCRFGRRALVLGVSAPPS